MQSWSLTCLLVVAVVSISLTETKYRSRKPQHILATKTLPQVVPAKATSKKAPKPNQSLSMQKKEHSGLAATTIVESFKGIQPIRYTPSKKQQVRQEAMQKESSGIRGMVYSLDPALKDLLLEDDDFESELDLYVSKSNLLEKEMDTSQRIRKVLKLFRKRYHTVHQHLQKTHRERENLLDKLKKKVVHAIHKLILENVREVSTELDEIQDFNNETSLPSNIVSLGKNSGVSEIRERIKSQIEDLTRVTKSWDDASSKDADFDDSVNYQGFDEGEDEGEDDICSNVQEKAFENEVMQILKNASAFVN